MVVPVLITSCHVSEKLKNGPVQAQITTAVSASENAVVPPVAFAACVAKVSNPLECFDFSGFMRDYF